MRNVYIPAGEPGSINDLTKRAYEYPDWVALEIGNKQQVVANVIHSLNTYVGPEFALRFALEVIRLHIGE